MPIWPEFFRTLVPLSRSTPPASEPEFLMVSAPMPPRTLMPLAFVSVMPPELVSMLVPWPRSMKPFRTPELVRLSLPLWRSTFIGTLNHARIDDRMHCTVQKVDAVMRAENQARVFDSCGAVGCDAHRSLYRIAGATARRSRRIPLLLRLCVIF